jgi:hypothetical protein
MENLKKHLQEIIIINQIKIDEMKIKLDTNYCHWFGWVAEDLYKLTLANQNFNSIISDIDELGQEEALYYWINVLQREINPSNVRENSTGSLHREASTYKFIVNLELLQWLIKL